MMQYVRMTSTQALTDAVQGSENSLHERDLLQNRDKAWIDLNLTVWGYRAAVSLALLMMCFCAWYIAVEMAANREAVNNMTESLLKKGTIQGQLFALQLQTHANTVVLISAGMIMGFAFGFLGFALFMMGIRGSIDVAASHGGSKATLSKLSPGLFVMLCATILIAFCIWSRPSSSNYSIVGDSLIPKEAGHSTTSATKGATGPPRSIEP
jgi:hypothetical protein